MVEKSIYAIMWKSDRKGLNITLNLPLFSSGGEVEYIKRVELPEPMTSNQFNNFITSEEGMEWFKQEYIKERPESAEAEFTMNRSPEAREKQFKKDIASMG